MQGSRRHARYTGPDRKFRLPLPPPTHHVRAFHPQPPAAGVRSLEDLTSARLPRKTHTIHQGNGARGRSLCPLSLPCHVSPIPPSLLKQAQCLSRCPRSPALTQGRRRSQRKGRASVSTDTALLQVRTRMSSVRGHAVHSLYKAGGSNCRRANCHVGCSGSDVCWLL